MPNIVSEIKNSSVFEKFTNETDDEPDQVLMYRDVVAGKMVEHIFLNAEFLNFYTT